MKPFCASSEEALSLTEDEFWGRVFYWTLEAQMEIEEHFSIYYGYDPYGVDREWCHHHQCVRCGTHMADDDSFCEDCLDGILPDLDDDVLPFIHERLE